MKIAILGHYGDFNLGDEAAIEAVVRNIRLQLPSAEICCISVRPDDSRARYGVDAFPVQRSSPQPPKTGPASDDCAPDDGGPAIPARRRAAREALKKIYPLVMLVRWSRAFVGTLCAVGQELGFLARSYAKLRELDLVLIAGSNQCFDFVDGPWHFPYNLLKWSVLTRLRGKKLAFVCVGAGPIRSGLSRWMLRNALGLAHYRSFRDESSKRLLLSMRACREDDPVLPDLAFSLPVDNARRAGQAASNRHVVGFNPMPLFDKRYWPDYDRARYDSLIDKYACLVTWLLNEGHRLVFYSTHPRDELVMRDISDRMPGSSGGIEMICTDSVAELLSGLQRVDSVVATRFHGILLAYLLGKPALGIEYWAKTGDLMRSMDQEDFLLKETEFITAERIDLEHIGKRFHDMLGRLPALRAQISSRNSSNRDALGRQYAALWALSPEADRPS